MGVSFRDKRSFTSGELSPRFGSRLDFDRAKNGCKKLYNMTAQVQGPVTRRPGLEFIYDMTSLGVDVNNHGFRQIPFIFSETNAYDLIFFNHTDGRVKMVVAADDGLVLSSGTSNVFVIEMPVGFKTKDFDYAQSLDELYIAQRTLRPIAIVRKAHDDWVVDPLIFTCFPDAWPHDPVGSVDPLEADYAATDDWPETVTFNEQRLLFAGSRTHAQTIFCSAAGSFLNFGKFDGTGCHGVEEADGFSFRLDSGTQNRIQWMSSGRALAVGTIGNEWTITGAGQFPMSAKYKTARRQTNIGSKKLKPLMIGLVTVFVDRFGRVVSEFKYDYTSDSYESSDRSVLATHLTDKSSIADWTYQQTPDNIVWTVLEDGSFLGCTFQREHKIVAWSQHETQGKAMSVTSIPGKHRADEVRMIIERTVGGAKKFYYERMAPEFLGETTVDCRFLDSFVVKSPVGKVVSGLDYLEGMEVGVVADGFNHPVCTVTGGQITLTRDDFTSAVVGLKYTSEVWPFLGDVPLRDGSFRGRRQRIIDIAIDFYKTLGGVIGTKDKEHGERTEKLPFRNPVGNMEDRIALFTEIYNYPFMEGFNNQSEYFIRQEEPLPMTVRGVIDTIEIGD